MLLNFTILIFVVFFSPFFLCQQICPDLKVYVHNLEYFALDSCSHRYVKIPDRYTAHQLGNVTKMDRLPINFRLDGNIASRTRPNDYFKGFASEDYNNALDLYPTVILNHILNPSYVYVNDDWIISWRLPPRQPYESSKSCRIAHISKDNKLSVSHGFGKNFLSDIKRLKSLLNPQVALSEFPHIDINNCEDLRLFTKKQGDRTKVMAHFARRFRQIDNQPEIQTCVCTFRLASTISIIESATVSMVNIQPSRDQKNWIHVDYNDSISFITQLSAPKVVIFLSELQIGPLFPLLVPECHVSSVWSNSTLTWKFGELRGGTSATIVDDEKFGKLFLSFFHSSISINGIDINLPKTYTMGAVAFQADPPFDIMMISKGPLSHSLLYSGDWPDLKQAYQVMDYIVFPMSIILHKSHVFVFYGFQDKDGWLVRIKYQSLLSSLISEAKKGNP